MTKDKFRRKDFKWEVDASLTAKYIPVRSPHQGLDRGRNYLMTSE